ncbi:helix-turn-helix domain-containing protein [Polaribacter porphyrae]|uniref:AraC family transcriptional regulator n=1 Tax=Polaribacter porphyrae TaxID=1137780 RepID=A0A2S7WRP8_9FLAO|nr:helix-turn-helix domain-containing protein [Polaribacter porphyrae]PQJ80254.1 AraC family transcriptional regulator [Polaribacter porphyrae]
MIFETHTLKNTLSTFIESVFYFKGFQPEHSIERVVPTGNLFIIFELDGFTRNTFDNETLKPNGVYNKVWISGIHKNYLSISAHQNSEMFVIQFKPFGAYPFLNIPINNLNDKVVAAETIFGDSILQLREIIKNKKTTKEKFEIAESFLNKTFKIKKQPQKELIEIINTLKVKPFLEHNSIVKSYSKTQKHLIHQFKKFCGLTPKTLHRIFRFNEVLLKIRNKEKIEWSQIAYEFGYSDQSHFIKEFKEFSGFNPQEFISSNFHKGEPNFFPLDKKG